MATKTPPKPKRTGRKPRMKIELTQQLALFLDNHPGVLARLCDALSDARINIWALSTSDTVDHIVIRMVVSAAGKAMQLLRERGTLVITTEVLMIAGANQPGSLAAIAHSLAKGGVNIDYAYCATSPELEQGLLILRVSDPKKALKILNS